MKHISTAVFWGFLLLFFVSHYFEPAPAPAQSASFYLSLHNGSLLTSAPDCGEKVPSPRFYENASIYSLIAGFALLFMGILVDRKKLKAGFFGAALLPLGFWVYIHFFIDFPKIQKTIFNYNAAAEATLANIAEAQDRYKSEHETFLNNLAELKSHTAGAHGMDKCVRILKIQAGFNHWSAEARHVSSPDKVTWDSRTGSSLKKG